MTQKFIHTTCRDGQDIFTALDELKADGKAPKNSSVADLTRYHWNDEKKDPSIIGAVAVRRNEMYAIKTR